MKINCCWPEGEVVSGKLRQYKTIGRELLKDFEDLLEKQDLREIEEMRKKLKDAFDSIEGREDF